MLIKRDGGLARLLGAVTFFVLRADVPGIDPATKGALIQTWNNLAVAAAAVWTTSSVVNRIKGNKP